MLEKVCFAFSVISNRDFEKFLKITLRVLVKLQTDTVFAESLSNTYNYLLILGIYFSISPLNDQKQSFTVVL